MRRCLELASLGAGSVSPNPLVGALLVHNGRIVAENYHRRYGGQHAEASVVADVLGQYGEDAANLFPYATMYVSLEPCAHFGKTPPCARMLAEHRVGRVVVACRDPFDQVNGAGIRILQDAGIDVVEGVLANEARWLNRRFFTRLREHRPYIILKWAQTADGYMAAKKPTQQWISGNLAKQLVHRWRSEEDAVLVGTKTALIDNPQLTVREWQGRHPKRVLIDRQLVVPDDSRLFDAEAETIVFNSIKTDWVGNIKYISVEDMDRYLPEKIVYQLYLMDIQSVIVEGGPATLRAFIQADLWDEARVFTSQETWGDGYAAPVLPSDSTSSQRIGADRLDIYYHHRLTRL